MAPLMNQLRNRRKFRQRRSIKKRKTMGSATSMSQFKMSSTRRYQWPRNLLTNLQKKHLVKSFHKREKINYLNTKKNSATLVNPRCQQKITNGLATILKPQYLQIRSRKRLKKKMVALVSSTSLRSQLQQMSRKILQSHLKKNSALLNKRRLSSK